MVDFARAAEFAAMAEGEFDDAAEEAMRRIAGLAAEFEGDGELMAYIRHARRHALDALVNLAHADPTDVPTILDLQSRIGEYRRVVGYVAGVMGVALVGERDDAEPVEDQLDDSGDVHGEGSEEPRRQRPGKRPVRRDGGTLRAAKGGSRKAPR